ncbi:hypothetical protein BC828DRAFT_416787 [Blastocladiella britannica]|nr:hypothetical protein BC828DRAFT_416787 [Blastocladiella britannica]
MTYPRYIGHLLPTATLPAPNASDYAPESLKDEGFVHCSSLAQALETANRYLATVPALSLLVIDTAKLGVYTAAVVGAPHIPVDGTNPDDAVHVVWEPPAVPPGSSSANLAAARTDQEFPHIYGRIPLMAVVAVVQVTRNDDNSAWVGLPGAEPYISS